MDLSSLIAIAIVFLLLWLIYLGTGKFIGGTPHRVAGVILGLIFLGYALNRLGLLSGIRL